MGYQEVIRSPETPGKNRIAVITGVSASGKDFLLENLSFHNPRLVSEFTVVSFGDALFSRIKADAASGIPIGSKDSLASVVSAEQMRRYIDEVIQEIVKCDKTLLNAHLAYKQQGSIQLNPNVDKRLNLHTYIFVWADPDEILQRRLNSERQRAIESVEDISLHQQIAFEATRVLPRHLERG